MLPSGTWELLLETEGTVGVIAFRCGGVSTEDAGGSRLSIVLDAPTPVDVVVGAAKRGVVAIRAASFVRSDAPAGFRCAPPGHRVVVPLSRLSHKKAAQSDWAAADNVLFRSTGLRVELPELSRARSVELTVDGNDRYGILFARGSQVEGTVQIEKSKKGGLALHELAVPDTASKTGFDRVEIVPLEGDNYYSVGHLLIAPD